MPFTLPGLFTLFKKRHINTVSNDKSDFTYSEKNNNTTLKVNLHKIAENYLLLKNKAPNNPKIMAMLKASGYGIGSIELAKFLQKIKVDYIAVAFIDEAIEIRKAGVKTPIMVIHPDFKLSNLLSTYNIEPEVFSLYQLNKLINNNKAKNNLSIHLKVDTGMNRLGIPESDIQETLDLIKSNSFIKVKSIMSHLSSADIHEATDFTLSQISMFESLSKRIEESLGYTSIKHILNTSGVENFSNNSFDMIRMGIGLLGATNNKLNTLKNPLNLYSHISQIKTVKKGAVIGYGQGTILDRDKTIAILPIGYADGYNRLLGNGVGEVFLNGQRVKTIGNISMDLTIIDISELDTVKEGDEVELMGDNISIYELAEKMNTIPYEVITSISKRVQRLYIEE